MKLVAMMLTRNEANRYLKWTIPSLLSFCDEVRVIDDDSVDGTHNILRDYGCIVKRNDRPMFFEHEGRARNALLDFALEGKPDYLFAVDADEIVADGDAIRDALISRTSASGVWNLTMEEVWKADERFLYERVDGQWGSRKCPVLFEVPARIPSNWRIADRALACGREPMPVAKAGVRRAPVVTSLFHLGWANESERETRYDRYVKHDGGAFHASAHLNSIMFGDELVKLAPREWPKGLDREGLLERINQ